MGPSGQDESRGHDARGASNGDAIDILVSQLEAQMADLQSRHPGSFGIAAAWADRHDAILAATPPDRLDEVRARLRRIGIRWGVVSGPRVTQEIDALPALPPLHRRRPPKR
ncbi:hypothetical protein GCM10028862_19190 [Luteimonas pelagia]